MTTLISELLASFNPKVTSIYSLHLPNHQKAISLERVIAAKMTDQLLAARRYHLSSNVTEVATLYAFNVASFKRQILDLARPPFDNMWIEWPLAPALEAAGVKAAQDAPERCGILIRKHGNRYLMTQALVVTSIKGEVKTIVSPISIIYDPTSQMSMSEYDHDAKFLAECISTVTDRYTFYGPNDPVGNLENIVHSTLVGGTRRVDQEQDLLHEILPHARLCITPYYGEILYQQIKNKTISPKLIEAFKEVFAERVLESSGAFRFVISVLALMNTKNYITGQPIKAGKSHLKSAERTRRPSPAYEFIELQVPATVIIREIQGDDHEKRERVRHEVSGHFCYSHQVGDPSCKHNFAKQSSTKEICLLCGTKRWWRKAHERGNAELGKHEAPSRLLVD